jgi:hypothetical protein
MVVSRSILVFAAIVCFIVAALPHTSVVKFEWLGFACLSATLLT